METADDINHKADAPVIIAREKIALAAGAALLIAGLILVIAVLPAEYGVDPLGIGARLGLTALNATAESIAKFQAEAAGGTGSGQPTIVARDREFKQETVDFKVAGGSFIEYKYRLDKGEALLFNWKASSAVNYDFHAEPDGAPRGFAESYEKGNGRSQAGGTFTAPFGGIHGWYWQNPGSQDVTVTLTTAGFYTIAHEFRPGEPVRNKTFQ
jgi:hypothetical protein